MLPSYFHNNDLWDVREMNLPVPIEKYRLNTRKFKLDFTKISNTYNKEAWKKFIYYQLTISKLTINTIYLNHGIIADFLTQLGDTNVDQIKFLDALNYSSRLNDRNNTLRTYNGYISVLRWLYNYLIAHKYALKNYFEKIPLKKIKRKPTLKEVDNEVIFRILSQLHTLPLKLQIMFLILYSGLRISYMLALEFDCLATEDGAYKLKFYNPAIRDYDYILISENLYLLIERYLKEVADSGSTSKYLFPRSTDPTRHDIGEILEKNIKKLAGEAGKKINFKLSDIRSSLLLRMFLMGVPLHIIQEVMKFNSSYTINQYYELFVEAGLSEVDAYMNGGKSPVKGT